MTDFNALCAELHNALEPHAETLEEERLLDRSAAALRAALAVPVPEPPAPPADYIDPEHSGTNREKLEVFYSATLREGGTADEIALRGINAVLARWGQPPAPPAEGEVAELVAWLHGQDGGLGRRAIYARIAELLERHAAPVPVPVPAPQGGEVEA